MKQSKLCRLCTKTKNCKKYKDLFEKNQEFLTMVAQITGIYLKKVKPLPSYICQTCQVDLKKAHAFRERCIKAQEYFNSTDFVKTDSTSDDVKVENELSLQHNELKDVNYLEIPAIEIKDEIPIEENKLQEFDFVKTECGNILCDELTNKECNSTLSGGHSRSNYQDGNDVWSAIDDLKEDFTVLIKKSTSKVKTKCQEQNKIKNSELETSYVKSVKTESIKQKTSKNKVTFICDQCGSAFAYRSNFMAHQRKHTGEKLYHCEVCPEKFFSNAQLELHVRKHTGERPFACSYCDRRFIKNSIRINHERTHTNERPYACNQCSKAFTNSFILKNHMITHTGVRSFRCNLCDKWFGQKPHLITHYKSMQHKQNEEKLQQKANSFVNDDLNSVKSGIAEMQTN